MTVIFVLLFCCCPEDPEPEYDIYLSLEEFLCTWVTLKVTLPDSGWINTFTLVRNDSDIVTLNCTDDDTLITDQNLTPNTDYSYRVRFLKDGKTKAESETVTVHTMPTTSHDFIWEIDTLGNYGSYLNDVWIVDENDIWVVGNIETDSGEYNAARWNGQEWKLMKIVNSDPIFSIWYFTGDDIWVVLYGYPVHWDGNSWKLYHFHNMGIDASALSLWGTSSSNMYFVGLEGSIVHYDGSSFTKLESGTDVDLKNIHGIKNGDYIFIVGWEDSGKSVALQLHEGTATTLYNAEHFGPNNNYGKVQSVSVINDAAYFSTRAGLWRYKYLLGESNLITSNPDVFSYMSIETSGANDVNDIMFMGLWFTTFHYNGNTWYEDRTVLDTYGEWNIYAHGGDFKDDLVVLVGYCYGGRSAIIGRGYRN